MKTAWVMCSLSLAAFAAAAGTALPDEAPAWSDEAPAVSRLLERGYDAQQTQDYAQAATRYCTAARYGSVEAQYRLGRLLLERFGERKREEGKAVLALAAQQGNEPSRLLLQDLVVQADLPDCLFTGVAPAFDPVADAQAFTVPREVVERYLLTLPQDKRRNALLIQRLAPRFNVDFRLALAIARAESNFESNALSPKNAMGVMQLIPDTAARFGVRNAFDPEQNVRGGLAYLRWLLERFGGDVALTSAAYNAGENAVERHGGVPPYAETQQYVQRILHFYRSPVHVRPAAM